MKNKFTKLFSVIRTRAGSIHKKAQTARQLRKMDREIHLLHGPWNFSVSKNLPVVLCIVKDGEYHAASFFKYYQSLGVGHIVLLDNGSTDKTIEIAQAFPNVTILRTALPYSQYICTFKLWLATRFGKNRWCLVVDIDELFDYPFSERLSLSDLIEYFDKNHYTGMLCHMLDMFSKKPLSDISDEAPDSLQETFPFFDLASVDWEDYKDASKKTGIGIGNHLPGDIDLKICRGGIRKKAFGTHVILSKHPLFKYSSGLVPFTSSHSLFYANLADVTGVLLHYKFTGTLKKHAEDIVTQSKVGTHGVSAFQHTLNENRNYKKILESKGGCLLNPASAERFSSTGQLVEKKFLVCSEKFVHASAQTGEEG